MWLRAGAILALVGSLLLVTGTGLALAQTEPSGDSAVSIIMNGRADVVQQEGERYLRITGDSVGGGGWHLEAQLAPVGIQRSGETEDEQQLRSIGDSVLVLLGSFTLTGDAGSVQGQAQATLSQQGSGDVQLTDQSGGTNLTSAFQIGQNGKLTLELHGQLPALASAPSDTLPVSVQATSPKAEESGHFFWYLSRSAGFTAYLLLFVSVCFGLLLHTGWVDRIFARWRSFDLHQFTGLLAMAFIGAHVLSLLGDHFLNFSVGQLFVPLASPYRPLWTGLGVLALYLLIVITGSFYIRQHIGVHTWRALHYFTFAAFLLVLGHGLLAGTDANTDWARLLFVSTGTVVALLTLWRAIDATARREAGEGRELARPVSAQAGRNGMRQGSVRRS